MLLRSFIFIFVSLTAYAAFPASPRYGQKPGYIDSVGQERNLRIVEFVFVSPPEDGDLSLKEIIFNDELKKEFKQKYEQEFGYTDAERNINAPNRYAEYEYHAGVRVTAEEDVDGRKAFGEYMIRRLTEHHFDNYIKTSPTARPVYELKEKISKVKLEVKKGYSFKLHYSYSGNYLDVKVDNPYDLSNKVTLQMNPNSFGPSDIQETILTLGYPFSPELRVESHYAVTDGVVSLIGSRKLSQALVATLTGETYVHENGESERQHRVIVGLTWVH